MEQLRKAFLTDSISRLGEFRDKIQNEKFAAETERELFRFLHTVKGTAQTFGLISAARTAHETESLLQALRDGKIENNPYLIEFLEKGLKILSATLQDKNQNSIERFFDEIKIRFPQISETRNSFVNLSKYISDEEINALSPHEKKSLISAVENGKKFFVVETDFDTANFSDELPKLRQKLDKSGEVIAVFPKPTENGKIGFRHFFVTDKNGINFFGSKVFEKGFVNFTNDLHGIFAQAAAVAEQTAKLLDKKISVETVAETNEIYTEHLSRVREILLHLIRNAIDHGIEKEGTIKIKISSEKDATVLKFSDDGRGIDEANLLAAAKKKKLIPDGENLGKEKLFELIFTHGLSLSENISEISGRGIGLDAVKNSVEKSGGKLRVESEKGQGTTFEILLKK